MDWERAPLIKAHPQDPQFWKVPRYLGPHRVLVAIPDTHRMVHNTVVRSDMAFILELARALSEAGLVRVYMNKLYARSTSSWVPLKNELAAAKWLQSNVLCVITTSNQPPYDWGIWTRNGCETALDYMREARGGDDVRDILRSPPEGLPRMICQSGGWEDEVKKAAGILQHPYHVDPAFPDPEWMPAYPQVRLREGPESYTHLKTLFDSLDLPPHAHCAVYCYLLGAFHVVSLTEQRPILVVDSWERGRGKTQLSAAIKYIIDKKDGVKSIRKGRDNVADESIASLRLNRVEVLDNIDREVDYKHDVAITATTSTLEARGKFEADSAEFPGKLFIMNCVVGACSMHRDLGVRILRVEIPGESKALKHPPINYARRYRDQIIYEIMHAHYNATKKIEAPEIRLRDFMQAGLTAYCHIFGISGRAARKSLLRAFASGRIYQKRALGSYMQRFGESLDEPYWPAGGLTDEIMQNVNFKIELKPADVGACALGHTVVREGDKIDWD